MSFTGMVQTVPIVGTEDVFVAFGPNRLSTFSHGCAPYLKTNESKVRITLSIHNATMWLCQLFFRSCCLLITKTGRIVWDSACFDIYIFIKTLDIDRLSLPFNQLVNRDFNRIFHWIFKGDNHFEQSILIRRFSIFWTYGAAKSTGADIIEFFS